MPAGPIQGKIPPRDGLRNNLHAPADRKRQWRPGFPDGKIHPLAIPMQRAWPDFERIGAAPYGAPFPFRHGKARRARTAQQNIQRAIIFRIGRPPAAARGKIPGRKNAADEGDQRYRVLAIVADGVNVPPGIAT
jgi:hypothetical protein